MNMQTKQNIFLWLLYDFANSIISITFFLYFAQWIVIDKGVSDLQFNLSFTISAVLLLFTAPILGAMLDKSLKRITGLRITTVLTALLYILCAIAAINNYEIISLVLFTLGVYTYILSFTFYTPLLNDIAPQNKIGKISGMGVTANYLGQFAGLIIALPFATGKWSLFGAAARVETLLPAIALFFILSLPMLLLFKEPKKLLEKVNLKTKIKQTIIQTKDLFKIKSVFFFLLAYFLFNDAILTAANNFPIFLEQVWHVSDTSKTYILLGILITSAIGGTTGGIIADKYGHKKTLQFILTGWIFLLPLIGLLTNFTLFIISTTLMGLWFGATWSVSRSVMSEVSPKGKHNIAFSYFGIAERASSLIGPIVWGLVVSSLVSIGSNRYRIATLVITLFIILGVLALKKVKDTKDLDKLPQKSVE